VNFLTPCAESAPDHPAQSSRLFRGMADVYEYIPPDETASPETVAVVDLGPSAKKAQAEARGCIDEEPLQLRAAVERFGGQEFDPRFDYRRTAFVYNPNASGPRSFESPEERLARLQSEVVEFSETIQAVNYGEERKVVSPEVLESLQRLQGRLGDLAQARQSPAVATSQPLYESILRGLSAAQTASPADAPQGQVSGYAIHALPPVSGAISSLAVGDLEARVAALEAKLGVDGALPFPDLCSGLAAVTDKVKLLDQKKLEQIHARLRTLVPEVRKLRDATGSQHSKEVVELYNICQTWDAAAEALPAVLERLRCLKNIHQAAAGFSERLTAVEAQQAATAARLATSQEAFKALRMSMAENMATMQANLEKLKEKMDAIPS